MSNAPDAGHTGASRRPNVVVILADDMGWGDLSCYGATKITTPAMDRLAAEGLRATDCHSASAVCTPSRYALLTGRYAWRGPLKRHVLFGHAPSIIEADRATLPGTLQDAGYATGAFGKWHLGLGWRFKDGRRWSAFEPGGSLFSEVDDGSNIDYAAGFGDGPIERGFDRFFGMTGSLDMQPYCFLEQDRTVGIPNEQKPVLYPQQRPGLQVEDWREDQVDLRFAEQACSWMREQASGGRPFFCYLALSAPHRPCMAPEFAQGQSEAGPRGDLVWMVDWVVGQVTALLEELAIAEDTLLIVTSDNGAREADVDGDTHGHLANGPWRGQKADIWEGGHREPFIARWPGKIAPGTVTHELVSLLDLFPTIAAACGVGVPAGAAEDACNFLPLLIGETERSPRTFLVHHSLGAWFSLRDEEWKVVMGTGSGGFSAPEGARCDARFAEGQLYDMQRDPAERANLWFARPDVVARLYDELKDITRGPSSGLSFDVAV